MSTAQILRAIHALPERAQWSLLAKLGVKAQPARSKPKAVRKSRQSTFAWNELHDWRKQTFGTRIVPNAVLEDRDDSPV